MGFDGLGHDVFLLIDTTGDGCRVALASEGSVVASAHAAMTRGHGEQLFALLDRVLSETPTGPLSAVVVHTGPGGFTGLRAGIAAATGLAAGYDVPLIGVTAADIEAASDGEILVAMAAVARQRLHTGQFGAKPVYALPPRAGPPTHSPPALLADHP